MWSATDITATSLPQRTLWQEQDLSRLFAKGKTDEPYENRLYNCTTQAAVYHHVTKYGRCSMNALPENNRLKYSLGDGTKGVFPYS